MGISILKDIQGNRRKKNIIAIMVVVSAIVSGIALSSPAPMHYKLAFLLLPAVVIFFALNPFAALMGLLIVRPELELFAETGLLKYFSAVPIVFLFFIFINTKKFDFCWDKMKYLYIFILLSLCTLIFSINTKVSVIYILKLLSVVSFYLIAFNMIKTRDDAMKLLYCFPLAMIVPLIIGTKQFIFGQTYVTEATQFERVEGLFVLANSFSRFLFVIILASIPLFYYVAKKKIPLLLLILSAVTTIILLKIRGVFLTMIFAFILLFYFTPKIRRYLWGIIPVITLLSIPVILKLFEHLIHPMQHRIYGGETLFWRLEMWKQLFNNAFTKRPLFGFGIGTSIDIGSAYTMFANYPHNDYLRILIENGILGFIFYLMFFVSNLRVSFIEIKKYEENKYFNIIAFILLISFVVMSSAANIFYGLDYLWYFFGFLAIAHKMNILEKENIHKTS